MNTLEQLESCAGSWHGTNRLHDPNTGAPEDSQCVAGLHRILDGLFLRFDYHWNYQGKAQEGSLLIGAERENGKLNGYWVDTWHMGEKGMVLTGQDNAKDKLALRGTYAAPPGPDWGWRIELLPDTDSLKFLMFNLTPEGEEQTAVETVLRRVPKLAHH